MMKKVNDSVRGITINLKIHEDRRVDKEEAQKDN